MGWVPIKSRALEDEQSSNEREIDASRKSSSKLQGHRALWLQARMEFLTELGKE